MTRKTIIVNLTEEDILKIRQLSEEQTRKYGHDRGHFSLGRDDSSHEIGFIGEVGVLRFLKDSYNLKEPEDIGLESMGDKFDVYVIVDDKKQKLHIKTGRRTHWPKDDWAFGVHWDQRIELSTYPIILVSFLKDNERQIKIEGFITADALGACKIIKKGENFPGMNYPSRCDNRLTLFNQYHDVSNIIQYLKTIDS